MLEQGSGSVQRAEWSVPRAAWKCGVQRATGAGSMRRWQRLQWELTVALAAFHYNIITEYGCGLAGISAFTRFRICLRIFARLSCNEMRPDRRSASATVAGGGHCCASWPALWEGYITMSLQNTVVGALESSPSRDFGAAFGFLRGEIVMECDPIVVGYGGGRGHGDCSAS